MMKRFAVIFSLLVSTTTFAQFPTVQIPGSEVRKITSSIVEGQEYELQVLLPGSYKTGSQKYPVIYLMDSQWDFPLVKSIYGQQYYDGFIPEVIIVGVTWGGEEPNADSLRARDYTPTKENRLPQSGGADRFLSFMKQELFPFIESNYKASAGNRVLMGCSLGGLFTLYTLFTQPELFTGYAAASPAIGWDKEVLRKYETEFLKKKISSPARVYITIGDVERGRPSFEKFAADIQTKNYSSLSIASKVLENTGHSGTKSETYTRGLQYIFHRPDIQLSANELLKYTGTFTLSNSKVEIVAEDEQLVLVLSPGNKYYLHAAGKTEFYSTAEFLNISFKTENENVTGFELQRYGSSQTAIKTK